MSRIPEDEVRRIAGLAGLELDEAEVGRLAEELGGVLEHVGRLRELEPGEPPPTRRDGVRLRPDVPSSDPMAAGPERAAPDWRDGYLVVPRLPAMERSDDGAA